MTAISTKNSEVNNICSKCKKSSSSEDYFVLLRCFHAICSDCFTKFKDHEGSVTCPLDKTVHKGNQIKKHQEMKIWDSESILMASRGEMQSDHSSVDESITKPKRCSICNAPNLSLIRCYCPNFKLICTQCVKKHKCDRQQNKTIPDEITLKKEIKKWIDDKVINLESKADQISIHFRKASYELEMLKIEKNKQIDFVTNCTQDAIKLLQEREVRLHAMINNNIQAVLDKLEAVKQKFEGSKKKAEYLMAYLKEVVGTNDIKDANESISRVLAGVHFEIDKVYREIDHRNVLAKNPVSVKSVETWNVQDLIEIYIDGVKQCADVQRKAPMGRMNQKLGNGVNTLQATNRPPNDADEKIDGVVANEHIGHNIYSWSDRKPITNQSSHVVHCNQKRGHQDVTVSNHGLNEFSTNRDKTLHPSTDIDKKVLDDKPNEVIDARKQFGDSKDENISLESKSFDSIGTRRGATAETLRKRTKDETMALKTTSNETNTLKESTEDDPKNVIRTKSDGSAKSSACSNMSHSKTTTDDKNNLEENVIANKYVRDDSLKATLCNSDEDKLSSKKCSSNEASLGVECPVSARHSNTSSAENKCEEVLEGRENENLEFIDTKGRKLSAAETTDASTSKPLNSIGNNGTKPSELQGLDTKRIEKIRSGNVPYEIRRIHSIRNQLYCIGEYGVSIYNENWEIIKVIKHQAIGSRATGMAQTEDGGFVVSCWGFECEQGLHLFDINGMYQKCLLSGWYSDVQYYKQKVYALEWNESKIAVFYLDCEGNKTSNVCYYPLEQATQHMNTKICVSGSSIYVSLWDNHSICVYNIGNGQLSQKINGSMVHCTNKVVPGQFRYPVVCQVDDAQNLLISDYLCDNNLHLLIGQDDEGNSQWKVVQLPSECADNIMDAVVSQDGSLLWVLANNKRSLVKYTIT